MSVKLLTEQNLEFLSLKGCSTGLSESTLVKMQHCWKSHFTAHMVLVPKSFVLVPIFNQHLYSYSIWKQGIKKYFALTNFSLLSWSILFIEESKLIFSDHTDPSSSSFGTDNNFVCTLFLSRVISKEFMQKQLSHDI